MKGLLHLHVKSAVLMKVGTILIFILTGIRKYTISIFFTGQNIQRGSPLNDNQSCVVAFNSNSQNVEKALMFLNWIQCSQKNFDLFNFGIKDRHYILKGELIDISEEITVDNNPYWWYGLDDALLNYAFMNINFYRPSVYDTNNDNYKKDYLKFIKSYTSYTPHEEFYLY